MSLQQDPDQNPGEALESICVGLFYCWALSLSSASFTNYLQSTGLDEKYRTTEQSGSNAAAPTRSSRPHTNVPPRPFFFFTPFQPPPPPPTRSSPLLAPPDPLHAYLGLCGLSLIGEPSLRKVHPALNITQRAFQHLQQLQQTWKDRSDSCGRQQWRRECRPLGARAAPATSQSVGGNWNTELRRLGPSSERPPF